MILLYLLVGAASLADGVQQYTGTDYFASVEIELAELSPRGEAGGYAIPASGCSGVFYDHCQPVNSYVTSYESTYTTSYEGSYEASYTGIYMPLPTETSYTGIYMPLPTEASYTSSYQPPRAGAELEVKNITNPESSNCHDRPERSQHYGWCEDDISINAGDEIYLRWDSRNASGGCVATNFSLDTMYNHDGEYDEDREIDPPEEGESGGDQWRRERQEKENTQEGLQQDVTEPGAGTEVTYTYTCYGAGGNDTEQITVASVGTAPTLSVDREFVRVGDEVTLTWDTAISAPEECSIAGPELTIASLSAQTGTADVIVNGESTYTLECPGGTDSVTIEILPTVQET